jgi:hypothetical protein
VTPEERRKYLARAGEIRRAAGLPVRVIAAAFSCHPGSLRNIESEYRRLWDPRVAERLRGRSTSLEARYARLLRTLHWHIACPVPDEPADILPRAVY